MAAESLSISRRNRHLLVAGSLGTDSVARSDPTAAGELLDVPRTWCKAHATLIDPQRTRLVAASANMPAMASPTPRSPRRSGGAACPLPGRDCRDQRDRRRLAPASRPSGCCSPSKPSCKTSTGSCADRRATSIRKLRRRRRGRLPDVLDSLGAQKGGCRPRVPPAPVVAGREARRSHALVMRLRARCRRGGRGREGRTPTDGWRA